MKTGCAEHRVLIVGAAAAPGSALAHALAGRGARVIVLDTDAAALGRIAGGCPGRIEPLALSDLDGHGFEVLGKAWGAAPLQAVVNLMPLADPRDLNAQIAGLRHLLLALMRGMIAGRGRLINIVYQPHDAIDLTAVGMLGAFEATQRGLNAILKDRGLYTHLVRADHGRPAAALPMLTFLAGPRTREVSKQRQAGQEDAAPAPN